jgi:hypothetical protein
LPALVLPLAPLAPPLPALPALPPLPLLPAALPALPPLPPAPEPPWPELPELPAEPFVSSSSPQAMVLEINSVLSEMAVSVLESMSHSDCGSGTAQKLQRVR